ncbi:hypothetical protein ACFVAV_04940 [Nocardia sp. NPDC057663]|uniref:hypothetical protein n=1 Tax=Nocardia sp. NPDC057663 TaxID=3346201 RepID=UPI00366A78B2
MSAPTGTDDLDDPFIARYAERVSDEVEVLWRADFARMVDMRERAFDGDTSLFVQADEIEAYWLSDPQVDPQWSHLNEIHAAWIHAPEAMRRAHEVTMPGGLQPPGMDQPLWSSHMQAREMTGHGYWPGFEPTQSLSSHERHEPMTNTTPAHVLDSETESDIERQMRTDYELAAKCHSRDPEEYDPADSIDAHEYASPWMNHQDHRYMHEWNNISEAEELWLADPDAAAAQLADANTAPLQRRHLEHGRDLSRGIYARDVEPVSYVTGTDSSDSGPYVPPVPNAWNLAENQLPSFDAARNNPARPVPEFGGVAERTSLLAASSGNALADALERQAEREGAER